MPTITLVFQAGFKDDAITVTLNQESQRLQNLTTDYSAGFAKKLELEAKSGENRLQLHHPGTDQRLDLKIEPEVNSYVLVDLEPDKGFEVRTSPEESLRY